MAEESTMQTMTNGGDGCMRGVYIFFFQAEDGIRDLTVTGVQTCALPIYEIRAQGRTAEATAAGGRSARGRIRRLGRKKGRRNACPQRFITTRTRTSDCSREIGRASCRERV